MSAFLPPGFWSKSGASALTLISNKTSTLIGLHSVEVMGQIEERSSLGELLLRREDAS